MQSNLSQYYIWHCITVTESESDFRIAHSRGSYGVSVVKIWQKIDRIIMALHCIASHFIWISQWLQTECLPCLAGPNGLRGVSLSPRSLWQHGRLDLADHRSAHRAAHVLPWLLHPEPHGRRSICALMPLMLITRTGLCLTMATWCWNKDFNQ